MLLTTTWHGTEGQLMKPETPITPGFTNEKTQAPREEATAQELSGDIWFAPAWSKPTAHLLPLWVGMAEA